VQRDVPAVSADAAEDARLAGTLVVNEVFFSIQGEGTRAGRPCAFVRLTGCPLRCVWCDTAYAFHEGRRRVIEDVLAEIGHFPARLLCLTGGEPLAQPRAFDFVRAALDAGWEVVVETSGHMDVSALDPRAAAILDVKTPGSGESHRMHWPNLDRLTARDEAKFVIDGRADYEWSRDLVRGRGLAVRTTVLFSAVHGALDSGELGRWILEDGLPVRLSVQLHKLLWPHATRGV
jgi:7-carboxy-7-deazaguanine synthase